MDESITTNATATAGNHDIPEWLVKRRAWLAQLEAAQRAATAALAVQSATETSTENADFPPADAPETETVRQVIPNVPVARPLATRKARPKSEPADSAAVPAFADAPAILCVPSADIAEEDADDESTLPWYANWIPDRAAMKSYGISVAMHLLIALPLSMVAFHQEISNIGINTLMAFQSDSAAGEALDDSQTFQIDASGGQTGEVLDTVLAASTVSNALGPSTIKVPDDAGGARMGEGDGAGNQIGNGLGVGGYKMPAAGKYVQKGSFTAWTEPADPEPGEDYKIIIQVKYKKPNQKVSVNDISGSVIGTDKFRLMISQYTSEIIPDANQVVVNIPGAAARVRDSIRVYSASLKENQRLEIEF